MKKARWEDDHRKDGSNLYVGRFRLTVHHYIGNPPEMWFATVYGVFERVELKAKTLKEAKMEATGIFKAALQKALSALP